MSAIMRRQLLQEMLKKLPKPAQDRVVALKNLQLDQIDLEAKFYEEVRIYFLIGLTFLWFLKEFYTFDVDDNL